MLSTPCLGYNQLEWTERRTDSATAVRTGRGGTPNNDDSQRGVLDTWT